MLRVRFDGLDAETECWSGQFKLQVYADGFAPTAENKGVYTTSKQLKMMAKTLGAKPVGSVFIGLMSQQEHPALPDKARERVRAQVKKLI